MRIKTFMAADVRKMLTGLWFRSNHVNLLPAYQNSMSRHFHGATGATHPTLPKSFLSSGFSSISSTHKCCCNLENYCIIPSRWMAGHSKWSNIKHIKAAKDTQKMKIYQKFSQYIKVAIKEGRGNDPKVNMQLANVIDRAKKNGMTNSAIENAVKGSQTDLDKLEHFTFDVKGPFGTFFVVEAVTHRRSHVKQMLSNALKKLGGQILDKRIPHLFDHKGIFEVESSNENPLTLEKAEDVAINIGAEDVENYTNEEGKEIYKFLCNPMDFFTVKSNLQAMGYQCLTSEILYIALTKVKLADDIVQKMERFYDTLDDEPEFVKIHDNIE